MLKTKKFWKLFFISFSITLVAVSVAALSVYAILNGAGAIDKDVKAGQKALEAGDLDTAKSHFESVLGRDKYSAEARIGLSEVYFSQDKVDDAIKVLEDGIALVEGNYDYYFSLIHLYVKSGKMDEAFSFLNGITNSPVKKKLAERQPESITADPAPKAANEPLNIKLTSSKDTEIYYTIDGSTPTIKSKKYSKAIKITEKVTLKAFAINEDGIISNLFSGVYNVFNGTVKYPFSDNKIEKIVRAMLNKPTGNVYLNDLMNITSFSNYIGGKPVEGYIVNLDDLASFTNLKEVSLINEPQISDLTPISNLENLKKLTLDGCNIDDNKLNTLSELVNITDLSLSKNSITNISILSKLVNLRSLSMAENGIMDLSAIVQFPALETLNLSNNTITDLYSISNAPTLKDLNLMGNQIADLTPLDTIKTIKSLNVSKNNILTLNGVQRIPALAILNASENSISDISVLSGNNSITELNLSYNNMIADLSPLSNTSVQRLTVTNMNISSLDSIADIPNLVYLNVSNNYISELYPLTRTSKLQTLDIKDNLVSSLLALRNCPALKTVYCSGNIIYPDNNELSGTGIQVYMDK